MTDPILQHYELVYYRELQIYLRTKKFNTEFSAKIDRLEKVLSHVIETPHYEYLHYLEPVEGDYTTNIPDGYYTKCRGKLFRLMELPKEKLADISIIEKRGDSLIVVQ